MNPTSREFVENSRRAIVDQGLQSALAGLPTGLVAQRRAAKARTPDFEAMRELARDIREHTLAHLDLYLEAFTAKAEALGTVVHFAADAAEARSIILELCQKAGAHRVAKGKSMVSEEIGLNQHLAAAGLEVVETDLGEYLVQIRGEAPSHIIAPAIHLTVEDVERDFRRNHTHLPGDRTFEGPADLVAEARTVLRNTFLKADVGITGANFLVAETGSAVLVTNEGNGDLTAGLPDTHIVVTAIDKLAPTLADTAALLRVLARSGTGQDITAYTTFLSGPRRADEPDGPTSVHIVIVDNGRSELLKGPMREALRCIRCGACINHCPVYNTVGGHAYGWVYSGPIGAVLTPAFIGIGEAHHLAAASSFCGRCEEVCPVKIPLPKLLRHWREEAFRTGNSGRMAKLLLRAWGRLARNPRAYALATRIPVAVLGFLGRRRGHFKSVPFAGGWTRTRDLPAPQGRTFQELWAETKRGVPR